MGRVATVLVERDGELERIDRVLDAVLAGAGRALSFEGEAGIGKSALCQLAATAAAERGIKVLRAVGGELEHGLSFGVVRQLLAREYLDGSDSDAQLHGDAALAVGVLDPEHHRSPDGEAAAFAINHGLYWLVAAVAERFPVLMIVDDAQWADEASLRFLAFLIPRLGDLCAGVVMAVRQGEEASPVSLDAVRARTRVDVTVPGPLSVKGVAALLGDYFASELSPAFVEACWRFCGGNPLYLEWVADELAMNGFSPTPEAVQSIPDAVSGSIPARVMSRLAKIGPTSLTMLKALAVLGPGAERPLLAELAQLSRADFTACVEELGGLHLIGDSLRISFAHPLIREAVYASMSLEERSALHERTAKLLAERKQHDAAAVHLLRTTPRGDPWVVDTLMLVAGRCGYTEAAEATMQLIRRALAEPPAEDRRSTILLELGRAERLCAADEAIQHLEEAQHHTDEVELIERSTEEMFSALAGVEDTHRRVNAIDGAISRVEATNPDAAIRLESLLIDDLLVRRATFDWGVSRMDDLLSRTTVDTPHLRCLRAIRTWIAYWAGEATAEQVRRSGLYAMESVSEADSLGMASLVLLVIHALQQCDCFERQVTLDRLGVLAREAGHTETLAQVMAVQSAGALIRGDARELEQRSTGLLHLATIARSPWPILMGSQLVIHAALAEGDVAKAAVRLANYEEQVEDPEMSDSPLLIEARYLRAMIRSAQGKHQEAVADIVTQLALDRTRSVPSLTIKSALTAAPIFWAAGEHELASEQADLAVDLAARRGLASQSGTAMVCLGLIRGGDEGLDLIAHGCSLLEATPRRLEYAQGLVAHGSALRRARRRKQARTLLQQAIGIASGCGAHALARRANQELETAGTRVLGIADPGQTLSPAERRVAELVSEGLSNPDIAQQLYLSRRTIEAHLRAILRKLNISSRQQIQALLLAKTDAETQAGR